MGRSRRSRAVLARRDGAEVPPSGLVAPRSARRRSRYAEGRCVGGSTEINCGLWHRLPDDLAEEWRASYRIDEFSADVLDRYAEQRRGGAGVSRLPSAPPPSSAALERGATKLGWRAVEFPRVFRYDEQGRGVKQTMARTMIPRAIAGGRDGDPRLPGASSSCERSIGSIGARCERTRDDGSRERLLDPRRPRLRVRRRRSRRRRCCSAAASARSIGRGPQAAPDDQDRGALPHPARPRRRADAPHHRVRAEPHDRRLGQPPRSRRARARRLGRRLRRRARRLGARRPSTTPPSAATAVGPRDRRSRACASPLVTVPAHRRRHEPAGARARPPRRGAARGRRDRAVPVGDRRARGRAGPTSWCQWWDARRPGNAPTS